MKKFLKCTALIAAAVMAFSFTACSEEEDDNGPSLVSLPKSKGTNVLAGHEYSIGNLMFLETWSFTGNTMITVIESEEGASSGFCEAYTEKTRNVYSYSVDATGDDDTKILFRRFKSTTTTLERDGQVLYKSNGSIPKTFAEYKKDLTAKTKAIVLPTVKDLITEETIADAEGTEIYITFKDFGYDDQSGQTAVSDEIFNEWYKATKRQSDFAETGIETIAYIADDSEIYDWYKSDNLCPPGTKLADIFNNAYFFDANTGYNGSSSTGIWNTDRAARYDEHNTIYLNANEFKVLSASAGKLTVAEVTGWDEYDNAIYDPSAKIELTVTNTTLPAIISKYSENEIPYAGVCSTVTYNGQDYDFFILWATPENLLLFM